MCLPFSFQGKAKVSLKNNFSAFCQHCNAKTSTVTPSFYYVLIGSLSTRVFETRAATGSELFSLLSCLHTTAFALPSIFSPLKMLGIKIWETPLSRHAKCPLPVVVRVSKTCVLKLPIISLFCNNSIPSFIGNPWRVLLLGNHLDIFFNSSVTYFLKYFCAKFREILIRTFPRIRPISEKAIPHSIATF